MLSNHLNLFDVCIRSDIYAGNVLVIFTVDSHH